MSKHFRKTSLVERPEFRFLHVRVTDSMWYVHIKGGDEHTETIKKIKPLYISGSYTHVYLSPVYNCRYP